MTRRLKGASEVMWLSAFTEDLRNVAAILSAFQQDMLGCTKRREAYQVGAKHPDAHALWLDYVGVGASTSLIRGT
jgi:hypothetical protein